MGFGTYRLMKPIKKRLKPYSRAVALSYKFCDHSLVQFFKNLAKYLDLYKTLGYLPDEATLLGLLNFDGEIKEHYISKSHMVARQKILNHPSFQHVTEDKAVFYAFCAKLGLPIPGLLALFFKNASGLHWGHGPLASEEQWIDFFENKCPDEFVIKPSSGVYGDDIIFVEKGAGGFSGKELFKKLAANQRYDSFVVQECLCNHQDLMEINPKRGLQTLRVTTYIDKNLVVHIAYAFFKPIVGDMRIDNHKSGTTGNLLCEIDLQDGTLGVPLLVTENGPVKIPNHPDTNRTIEGIVLPFWEEAFDVAKKMAPHFLPMRTIGWDIAISSQGIRVIEGNARWDPPLFGTFGEDKAVFSADL